MWKHSAFCIIRIILEKTDISEESMSGEIQMKFIKDNLPKGKGAWILLSISVVICLATFVGIWAVYYYFENPQIFRDFVEEHYIIGAVMMFTLFVIQVILALIPGGLLEIACGYAFGSIMGSIISVAGIMTGSALTIFLVRLFGRKFAELFYPKEKLDSISILKDKKKRNLLVFIVFLIPGTPKDLLTYVVGLTDMSIPQYLLITGIARTPAIVISTIGGDALGLENYWQGLLFLGGLILVSGIGVFIYKKMHKKES